MAPRGVPEVMLTTGGIQHPHTQPSLYLFFLPVCAEDKWDPKQHRDLSGTNPWLGRDTASLRGMWLPREEHSFPGEGCQQPPACSQRPLHAATIAPRLCPGGGRAGVATGLAGRGGRDPEERQRESSPPLNPHPQSWGSRTLGTSPVGAHKGVTSLDWKETRPLVT